MMMINDDGGKLEGLCLGIWNTSNIVWKKSKDDSKDEDWFGKKGIVFERKWYSY